MSLPPAVQTLVDQLIQQLGLHAMRPESLSIHFDREGVVQAVKPQLSYRRVNALDKRTE